jgi:hypothetical protein
MFQDIMDELQFFPLVFNFDICCFDIYGTLVARINRVYRGLPLPCITLPGNQENNLNSLSATTLDNFRLLY